MEKDARIILKTKENGGAVSAVCMGIRETRGEYICFVDSDDIVGIDYIQNYVDQLDKEYDFIAFGFYYEDGICKKPYYLKETRIY
ncbi:glycosyltransferase family A protein, partial [Acinetobacter baumannii]|nr:glycosyltransferase family A protein [Acinetobacter baumannii]